MSFLSEIQAFRRNQLRQTSTTITTAGGQKYLEVHDKYGRSKRTLLDEGEHLMFVGDVKPDLQIGCILPGLLLSSQDVAADFDTLKRNDVTHILNVASRVDNMFPEDFIYKHIDILDIPETNIVDYFLECFTFIDEGRSNGTVLVHCNAGVSRSASIVIGYLMKHESMTFEQAYAHVKEKRSAIRPNDGFMKQLKEYKPIL